MHIDLGRRQSDTRGLIHGFKHIIDQRAQLIVYRINHPGRRAQPRIGVMEYVETSYVISVTNYRLCRLYTLT